MEKKHLLILHNGSTADGAVHIAAFYAQMGFDVTTMWAAIGDFPADFSRFDACFLTGSPHGAYEKIAWIEREHEVIQAMAAKEMPMTAKAINTSIKV